MKCEDCNTEKPDAEKTFCPVSLYVSGQTVEVVRCDGCHQKALNDIESMKSYKKD